MDDGISGGRALTLYTSWFSTFARKVALGPSN